MEKYVVIGNPIKHSISPLIHNTFFKDMNIKNSVYETMFVEDLTINTISQLKEKNILGVNVTLPYKIDIIKYLYDIDENAKKIGAVNTLKYTKDGYIGYNTDIVGMLDALNENNVDLQNKNVLILGAGGSGYTACFMALNEKANKIYIANRTKQNAKNLKKYYNSEKINIISLEDLSLLKDVNIVINTTTVGFADKEGFSLIDDLFFKNNFVEFVFDIIYTPFETKLIKIAKQNNIKTDNGFGMLVYQALKGEEIWQNKNLSIDYKIKFKNKILNIYKNM